MCTNFTPTKKKQWAKEKLGVELPADYPAESYPGFAAPLVVKSHQSDRVACGFAKFGLIPSWAKDEKITDTPTTLEARLRPRCLVTEHLGDSINMVSSWSITYTSQVTSREGRCAGRFSSLLVIRLGLLAFGIVGLIQLPANLWSAFSMLTVNADEQPVMRQFHKPGDEKRTPLIIAPDLHDAWLGADPAKAAQMMTWSHMPELRTEPAPKN